MIAVIVQARMGSTRLPGKVLKEVGGRPLLSYQFERLRRARRADLLAVATTTKPADDAIVSFCAAEGIPCTRGSESDVLSRYVDAARTHRAEVVVRVTSDCPLIDPQLVDDAIDAYVGGNCDYVSNMIQPTWPYGMAVEVTGAAILETAHAESHDPAEREHVTPFIYWRPERFRLHSLTREPDLSHHRWTVDTPEDFELVSRLLSDLYPRHPEFQTEDVLAVFERHPDWIRINSHVSQHSVAPSSVNKE